MPLLSTLYGKSRRFIGALLIARRRAGRDFLFRDEAMEFLAFIGVNRIPNLKSFRVEAKMKEFPEAQGQKEDSYNNQTQLHFVLHRLDSRDSAKKSNGLIDSRK